MTISHFFLINNKFRIIQTNWLRPEKKIGFISTGIVSHLLLLLNVVLAAWAAFLLLLFGTFFIFFTDFGVFLFTASPAQIGFQRLIFLVLAEWARRFFRFGHLTGSLQFFCKKVERKKTFSMM